MNAVLALNSGANELGEPSPETTARIDAAADFARTNHIGMLVMVGGDTTMMRDYLMGSRPDSTEPKAEGRSKDTLEGAHLVKLNLLVPLGVSVVDIFTNDFHVQRTDWIYKNVLGPGIQINAHSVPSAIPKNKESIVRNRERLQLAVAKLKLIGLGPDDDEQRSRRLEYFRYRGRDNLLAKFLVMVDRRTNIKRY